MTDEELDKHGNLRRLAVLPEEVREAVRRFITAAGPSWHSSIDGEQVDNLAAAVCGAFDVLRKERDAAVASEREWRLMLEANDAYHTEKDAAHRRGMERSAAMLEEVTKERDKLRFELDTHTRTWCLACCDEGRLPSLREAVVTLTWSDRRNDACVEHIPEAIVAIALDHSYDRHDIEPSIDTFDGSVYSRIVCGCAGARAWLDENHADWRGSTVNVTEEEREALLTAVRKAVEA